MKSKVDSLIREYKKKEQKFRKYMCNCEDFGFPEFFGVCGSCLRYPDAKPEISEQILAIELGYA